MTMADWQGFYSLSQISRLSGVPVRTLYGWKVRDIIAPSLQIQDASGKVKTEGYSYADLTIIRLMWALRKDQIDFRSAGIALRHLYERLGPPSKGWVDAQVHFIGNQIYAYQPDEWKTTSATRFGQRVAFMGEIIEELSGLEEGASIVVPKEYRPYVDIDPQIMGGEPVMKGTRIPTTVVAALSLKRRISDVVRLYAPIPKRFIEKAIEYERFLDKPAIPGAILL